MRSFNFWVRIVAISQLSFIVLANYGDYWLAPDNPLVARSQAAGRAASIADGPSDSSPQAAEPSQAKADDEVLRAERWGGGAGYEPIEPDEEDQAEIALAKEEEQEAAAELADSTDDSRWSNKAID